MTRVRALPTLFSLSAIVAVAACSSDANKAADTTATVAGTATTATTTTTASTTPSTSGAATNSAAIVPININTATDAEILRIPGVGPRMLREFKEYRPYTSIEQFRREIGKYVDKAEVARLEKYIVIK
jgi:DNA uptake protein ComE-like DNA-binding protein